jgi:prepilin-type N-terminal cleavage/methylation domain-containing protein
MKKLKIKKNRGFTYVELIVVLSIWAIMSSILFFNYGTYQATVDVNNYANQIALEITQAQRAALSGEQPPVSPTVSPWRPSYGVYFNIAPIPSGLGSKNFIYYADLNNTSFDGNGLDWGFDVPTESLENISMTKGEYISDLSYFKCGNIACSTLTQVSLSTQTPPALDITFTRPNFSAAIYFGNITSTVAGLDHVQITIASPQGPKAYIEVYPSGRVDIN